MKRYITIGRYQYSISLLLIIAIVCPIAFGTTYHIWTSKTASIIINEPLQVVDFPQSIRFHPGQNATINIVITNSATNNYEVQIDIKLSDTQYQQLHAQVSSKTYTIIPGNNTILAWIAISKDAPPSQQEITIDFLRLA